MISVTVFRINSQLKGFEVSGHAGYAESGNDIVCAAVSALVIATINGLEKFTGEETEIYTDEESGHISLKFKNIPGRDAQLLTDTMLLGIKDISKEYGNIKINTKEV